MSRLLQNHSINRRHDNRGVVLLVTIVVLVILAALAYTLTAAVSSRRHRRQYMIDYCQARYACDSALKYAFVSLESTEPNLISRPNEPDFSDVFAMSEPDYRKMLAQWLALNPNPPKDTLAADSPALADSNDVNDVNDPNKSFGGRSLTDSNLPVVRGPYGSPWPYLAEPLEFEIGSAKVKIELEDENAKYPLAWILLDDEKLAKEAQASFETFFEWMGYKADQINLLEEQFAKVRETKPFKLEFKPVAQAPVTVATTSPGKKRTTVASSPRKILSVAEQAARQYTDLAAVFHSSLVDRDVLAAPTVASDTRKESALKYAGLWAAGKVNVNTAPRHVLEAAFTFGGLADAPRIADQVIQQRRVKPFGNIEELRKSMIRYSTSIQKCESFITTSSNCFTVRITAVSGVARACAVAAVTKEGNKIKPIAIISD